MGDFGWTVVNRQMSLSSSDGSEGGRFNCLGHSDGRSLSQGGTFHHNSCSSNSDGKRPLDAQSTGFSVLFTWFHLSGGMCSTIDVTRLSTKVLKLLGFQTTSGKQWYYQSRHKCLGRRDERLPWCSWEVEWVSVHHRALIKGWWGTSWVQPSFWQWQERCEYFHRSRLIVSRLPQRRHLLMHHKNHEVG